MSPKYLTKSAFKLALECPTKLYYLSNPEYLNSAEENTFLAALAEGGFQVGELAKQYVPGGHQISSENPYDYEAVCKETEQFLTRDEVILYEAAITYKNFFIRTDILSKKGNRIEILEVKSKSFSGTTEEDFLRKKRTISSEWISYIFDVAFQKYIVQKAYPDYIVSANLYLPDKNSVCPTDGLNQKFKISQQADGETRVFVTSPLTEEELKNPMLLKINVDGSCEHLYQSTYQINQQELSFPAYLEYLADAYMKKIKIPFYPSAICGRCEFQTKEDHKDHYLSGFKECWTTFFNWSDNDFKDPTILELWNYRKKNQCLEQGVVKLKEVTEDLINPQVDDHPGLSATQRQWLQIQKVKNEDSSCWIYKKGLRKEFDQFRYPLHFIDFETSAVAIPFTKGRHPYEGLAFQFSHHMVYQDGRVEHKGEYLHRKVGEFPNYDFIRALKKELETDQGSIFRYADHENSYLMMIYEQLRNDQNLIADREELCDFILSITKSKEHTGERNMIDMLELVRRYYYDPAMKGSNSIKKVLPSILNNSQFLQEKYSKPIYGAPGGIPSHNFKEMTWVHYENGIMVDPYHLLPSESSIEINQGGAAMIAYAKLQFEEISQEERTEIEEALLRYCELDTLAMVMIYEGWKDFLN